MMIKLNLLSGNSMVFRFFISPLVFFIFFSFSQVKINAQTVPDTLDLPQTFYKKVTIDLKDVTFENVLNIISEKGKFKLNYNASRIPADQKISVKMFNKKLIDILNYILELTGTKLRVISNGQILILPAKNYEKLKGKIIGKVINKGSQRNLIGANILIEENLLGAASDVEGRFEISNLPVGNYTIKISYVGFQTIFIPDVLVRSDRITFMTVELTETPVQGHQVVVEDNYFQSNEIHQTSHTHFSSEEIRRAATLGGDISRIINGLPSLSNDNETNNIIARGGSSIENGFYIDNIEIPNINHLPFPGTTGGLFSILNLDFVSDINVSTGGFSAKYGDKLSSILDIKYREGNREEVDMQVDVNLAGVSGQVEGPLTKGNGSYMFFARHSFTDLVLKLSKDETDPITFNELQGKIVYDISPNHQISLLSIFSDDKWTVSKKVSISDYSNWYGNFNFTQNLFGINWKYLWGKKGYSITTASHFYKKNDIPLFTSIDDQPFMRINSIDNEYRLRNINYFSFSPFAKFEFGVEGKIHSANFNNYFAGGINPLGVSFPDLIVDRKITTSKIGGFFNYEWIPSTGLKFVPGIRIDYFSFNKKLNISPRFSFSYQINEKSAFNGSAGLFFQNLPMYFLSNNEKFENLEDPFSYHMIFGYNYLLFENTKLNIEFYIKEYQQLPVDPDMSSLFLLDEPINNLLYLSHNNLVMEGVANSLGIEAMIQKKISDKFHCIISGTYFRAKYRDLEGRWRNRTVDSKVLAAVEGGYKPNEDWELSLRWNYAGGKPFTKFNLAESTVRKKGILDKDNLMSERYPAYQNMSIRIDRRFYFENSNLILYISVWNLFNKKNISRSGWAETQGVAVDYNQINRIILFGAEFEF